MKKQVPFSMAVENVKLMQECSPEHLHMHKKCMIKIRKSNRGRRQAEYSMNMGKRTTGKKNRLDGLTIARAYRQVSASGSCFSEAMAELPNESNQNINIYYCYCSCYDYY